MLKVIYLTLLFSFAGVVQGRPLELRNEAGQQRAHLPRCGGDIQLVCAAQECSIQIRGTRCTQIRLYGSIDTSKGSYEFQQDGQTVQQTISRGADHEVAIDLTYKRKTFRAPFGRWKFYIPLVVGGASAPAQDEVILWFEAQSVVPY